MGWHWFHGAQAGLSYGMWRCLAQLPTPIWKFLFARQALQSSWQHLTRWSSMLESHHRVNSSRPRWSPTAQSTGMLFSSWASWASDWRRRPGMFKHLRFYSNGYPLWCNVLIRFFLYNGFVDDDRPELGSLPNKFWNFCHFCAHRGFYRGQKNF